MKRHERPMLCIATIYARALALGLANELASLRGHHQARELPLEPAA